MSGNDPSVNVQVALGLISGERLPLQRALFTFYPSTLAFQTGLAAQGDYGPVGARRGMVLTATNYRTRLEAAGALPDEPILRWLNGFWNPRGAVDLNGDRSPSPVQLTDRVYIYARDAANTEPTSYNFDVTTNTIGTITVTVSPFGTGDGTSRVLSSLGSFTVTSDGVKLASDLRDEIVAGLNGIAAVAAVATAAPGGATDGDLTTNEDGYPLILRIAVTAGGPVINLTETTVYTPGSWELDFDSARQDVEVDGEGQRSFWWVHDIQCLDDLNQAAMAYMETLANDPDLPAKYIYAPQSHSLANFDPTAVGANPAEAARDESFERSMFWSHDLLEPLVACALGRAIGYQPGEVVFNALELNGSLETPSTQLYETGSRITKRSQGLNEVLANEENRSFNFYSGEGPAGETKWGLTPAARQGAETWIDNVWLTDWLEFVCERDLGIFKRARNIVTYTNEDIAAGAEVLRDAAAAVPAIIPESVNVSFLTREQVSAADRQARRYNFYVVTAESAGAIARLGTRTQPITVNVSV